MSLFSRLSLIKSNFISSALATVLVAILAALALNFVYKEKSNADNDKDLIAALKALDNVAHQHAVERGLTAGFLGNPNDESRGKVINQRSNADASETALRAVVNELGADYPQVVTSTKLLLEQLNGKPALREEVNNLDGARAFGYYSTVNRMALDALTNLSSHLTGDEVASDLSLSLLLGKFKERAGQVRGKINGVLARKALSPAARTEVQGYSQDLDLIVDYLSTQMTGETLNQVNAILNDDTSQQIRSIISKVLADNPDFESLPGPGDWFPLATKQIGNVKKLLDQSWEHIAEEAEARDSAANLMMSGTLAITIIGLLILALFNLKLTSVLRSSLNNLTTGLHKVSVEHDLSVKLDVQGNNELAQIARAIEAMLASMDQTIRELINSVNNTTRMSEDLSGSSNQLLNNAQDTQRIATSISSAIEENAATSSEIANSASQTLDAVRQLSENGKTNSEHFNQTLSMISALEESAGNIQNLSRSLDQHVNEITTSIDTINNLFEQTNLLALNASIEAARAGEQGRGFAVVADEVRTLAIKSLESSENISRILKSLQEASSAINRSSAENGELNQSAASVTREAQETLEQMMSTMNLLESMATTVATAAEEQSSVSNAIASDTASVLDSSNNSLELSERLDTMSQGFYQAGQQMLALAKQFKVK